VVRWTLRQILALAWLTGMLPISIGLLDMADAQIERLGLNIPSEHSARTKLPDPRDLIEPLQPT